MLWFLGFVGGVREGAHFGTSPVEESTLAAASKRKVGEKKP